MSWSCGLIHATCDVDVCRPITDRSQRVLNSHPFMLALNLSCNDPDGLRKLNNLLGQSLCSQACRKESRDIIEGPRVQWSLFSARTLSELRKVKQGLCDSRPSV